MHSFLYGCSFLIYALANEVVTYSLEEKTNKKKESRAPACVSEIESVRKWKF